MGRSENIRNFLKESMAGVDRDGDSSGEKKSNKSNPSKRPASKSSRPKAYLSGSDKEPQAQESGKKYLISRLFSTYQSIKNENDIKSIKSTNSHSSRKEIRFNVDEYKSEILPFPITSTCQLTKSATPSTISTSKPNASTWPTAKSKAC